MATKYDTDLAFYQQLIWYYQTNKGRIQKGYKGITKKLLAYNDRKTRADAYLRPPQFEAFEIYVFFKEYLGNMSVREAFDEWRNKTGKFVDSKDAFRASGRLFDIYSEKQTEEVFKQLEKADEPYPNYIYALTMGLGKTVLMATCIYYEFLLANKFPKDERFCHNALVFAPDKTVLQSLKEIVSMDKALVLPPEYVSVVDSNLKVHFLEDAGTTLNTLDDSDFNLIISNDQKIIAKQRHKENTATDRLFDMPSAMSERASEMLAAVYGEDFARDDKGLIFNQRYTKLTRLRQLGVYVDEAHHLFGKELVKSLTDKKSESSLRRTINLLDEELRRQGTAVVGCFNYTGTPYANNKVLPEVVYAYGLRESIQHGYLKTARVLGYDNVKSEAFLRFAITEFWNTYGENKYEGLLPKLAIFASRIEEAEEEVRPAVERVLAELGIDTNKILVNTEHATNEEIHAFNNLDNPNVGGNDKQFIILVQKGREGWNCRSLFGVAMYRSPKSKVFVLQATMRCLRQITDVQQEATVFLSKENEEILDNELRKNFNMEISEMKPSTAKEKKTYRVRVVLPEVRIPLSRLRHNYAVVEKALDAPLDFGLDELDLEKYRATVTEKKRIDRDIAAKTYEISGKVDDYEYSLFSLVPKIASYIGAETSCVKIEKMLRGSVDGADKVLELVNFNEDILYDVIIPKVFDALYEVRGETVEEPREITLLRKPKNAEYYEFSANPSLVKEMDDAQFIEVADKSFHADTYCFDSKPEQEVFMQYIFAEDIDKVYFTGMFTSGQGDLMVNYYDPESMSLRSYYPDFLAVREDGTVEIIEVKGENKLDDPVVKAKARAAEETAAGSRYVYRVIPGNFAMENDLFADDVQERLEYWVASLEGDKE
ncbi:DEAD/DEAH box helicase family protein [Adlercreutzia sp. ZJ304]|uniref:DEAD/DEAH box helicase family protein n=1 Tax=Adlercreutzia sp. ZJ304 TaxID=2709791 RepID=UPI0013EC099F|nr:DEAD/DEAH box helicase family protein [Adlercreutzia sp. ZJ304]